MRESCDGDLPPMHNIDEGGGGSVSLILGLRGEAAMQAKTEQGHELPGMLESGNGGGE